MYDYAALPYYIQIPGVTPPTPSGQDAPVFHAAVDCPANVWSAIRSCPALAGWILAIGVGGLLIGYYVGRR